MPIVNTFQLVKSLMSWHFMVTVLTMYRSDTIVALIGLHIGGFSKLKQESSTPYGTAVSGVVNHLN